MEKQSSHLVILRAEAPTLKDGLGLRALGRAPCDGDLVFVRHQNDDIASGEVLANHEGKLGLMLVDLEGALHSPIAYQHYQLRDCDSGSWTLEKS